MSLVWRLWVLALCSLRGHCEPCAGKLHVDGYWKRVTFLLYLNEQPIVGQGGNLQLLTSARLPCPASRIHHTLPRSIPLLVTAVGWL